MGILVGGVAATAVTLDEKSQSISQFHLNDAFPCNNISLLPGVELYDTRTVFAIHVNGSELWAGGGGLIPMRLSRFATVLGGSTNCG